jgi:hypothetical protein
LSLRDVLDRIVGRRRGGAHGLYRPRSRSEPTTLMGAQPAETGMAPSRTVTAEQELPGGVGAGMGAQQLSTPEHQPLGTEQRSGAQPAPSPALAPADEPTQYLEAPVVGKSDVTGVLVAIDGELKGEVFPIYDGENALGRSESGNVVLPSQWISRQHALLVHQDGVFAIVPLSEKNRTYVNREEVDGTELSDGDELRLGHTTFRFRTIQGP